MASCLRKPGKKSCRSNPKFCRARITLARERIRFSFGFRFTRREKLSAKPSREKISVTSAVTDHSQFTFHIRRRSLDLAQTRGKIWRKMGRKELDVFGFERLNKHQEEALRLVVESKSDVFVNLPTGFGKSVVFQALSIVNSYVEPSN